MHCNNKLENISDVVHCCVQLLFSTIMYGKLICDVKQRHKISRFDVITEISCFTAILKTIVVIVYNRNITIIGTFSTGKKVIRNSLT